LSNQAKLNLQTEVRRSIENWLLTNISHRRSNWQNQFSLLPADGLNSNVEAAELFDLKLEENFALK